MGARRVDDAFDRARASGRAAFIPFVEAGDPSLATTEAIVLALESVGADLVEIGFPYSDPLADGPVIQRAAYRSLEKGTTIDGVLDLVRRLRRRTDVPLLAMLSYGLVHRFGQDRFVSRASRAGFDGAILPDLPVDEGGDLLARADAAGLPIALLVAQTTSEERQRRIVKAARGFVYYVSRTGVTGTSDRLAGDLVGRVRALRAITPLPVAVGFGVSRPEHVSAIAAVADGVIVGSRLVTEIERSLGRSRTELVRRVAALARRLRGGIRNGTLREAR